MKLDLKNLSKLKIPGYGERLRPNRDWLILFSLSCVLLAAGVVWHMSLFSKVTKGEGLEGGSVEETGRTPELDAVGRQFEARKAEEEKYLGEYRFVDPSR
jgi:hypothetical protein